MVTLRLPAPAKINTFLHVVGRRDDGYHLLESVMVFVSLADTVTLTRRDDGAIRLVNPPAGITEANDLACRAARALQLATGTTLGVEIELSKRIPQGAGLGGGSSDAATTLLGLNRLWKTDLSRPTLMTIALPLGADVPFFVYGRAALVSGIGERLRSVHLAQRWLVLAHPGSGAGVATAQAFQHPDLRRNTASVLDRRIKWASGANTMQTVAEQIQPEAKRLREQMELSQYPLRMSGSGSAYFAVAPGYASAQRLAAELRGDGFDAWAVRSSECHPLRHFAKDC